MDKLRERAIQYNEGLFTSREFIGTVLDELNEHWLSLSANECADDLADKLAKLLVQP